MDASQSTLFGSFLAAFIPLFVAMDVIGVLPIYISLIEGHDRKEQRTVLLEALLTVMILGLLFVTLGRNIFSFLGVTLQDFMIGGGLIMLILAISDLVSPEKTRQRPSGSIGVVPIGMPLIMGPASITTLMLHADMFGLPITIAVLIVNLIIALAVFSASGPIMRLLGKGGTQAVSKVANLLLAAIAVMIIRRGLIEIIQRTMQEAS